VETLASGEGGVSQDFSQAKIQLAEFASRNWLLLGNAENLFAKRGRKVERSVSKQLRVELEWSARDAGKSSVNAIGRGARHEAENQHGLGIGHTMSFSIETAKGMEKS